MRSRDLVDLLSWRAIFLAPVGVPALAFLIPTTRVPETPRLPVGIQISWEQPQR